MAIAQPEILFTQNELNGLEPLDPQTLRLSQHVIARFTTYSLDGLEVNSLALSGEVVSVKTRSGKDCTGPNDVPSTVCLNPDVTAKRQHPELRPHPTRVVSLGESTVINYELKEEVPGAIEKRARTGLTEDGTSLYGSRWFLQKAIERVVFYPKSEA